jgi:hypothetical protein
MIEIEWKNVIKCSYQIHRNTQEGGRGGGGDRKTESLLNIHQKNLNFVERTNDDLIRYDLLSTLLFLMFCPT